MSALAHTPGLPVTGEPRLDAAIQHAAHWLPAQAPLHGFVHHNTLHVYEDHTFEEAVRLAYERFGAQPYLSEEAFAGHLASGRIRDVDIDTVLRDEGVSGDETLAGKVSEHALRRARLLHPFEVPRGPSLQWWLEEGNALRTFHPAATPSARAAFLQSDRVASPGEGERARTEAALRDLFQRLTRAVPTPTPNPVPDTATRQAVNALVHPLLIRLSAAFLDQGVAHWSMPDRDRGFYEAFRALYTLGAAPPDPWLQGLRATLQRQSAAGMDAHAAALAALESLGVGPEGWDARVEESLLSLRGWAGMMNVLEHAPDKAPVRAPRTSLVDYLAVQLTLEAQAVRHLEAHRAPDAPPPRASTPDHAIAYEGFVLAQLLGLGPHAFDDAAARTWLARVAAFDALERRRVLQLAYERRHRVGVLDAALAHAALGAPQRPAPRAQLICCIDDREESFRRHLEERSLEVETLGYAGFFGIAMAYLGHGEIRPRPMCPVVVTPKHVIREEALTPPKARAALAHPALLRARHAGRTSLVRGAFASFAGLASTVPLVARTLFPRAAARLVGHTQKKPPATRLHLVRQGDERGPDGLLDGYSIGEMADVVAGALRTMGLDAATLAPLVVLVGHGSASMNNPLEAAYCCGACAGGFGGSNARAFAAMANDPRVRTELGQRGLAIPDATWFVGTYHDTCDDSVVYYDLDLAPDALAADLTWLRALLESARRLDAQERCRRFDAAPLSIGPDAALSHVEARASDLAQPRPEYGHATNAVCVVGPRARTRGLFLDRRAFLVSYDAKTDPNGQALRGLLAAVGPVCAGINLEYYFSCVDNEAYGCGTKLPHNVTGLIGLMNGHASDLRTGLAKQMIEIHEPVRLLTIIEAEVAILETIFKENPDLEKLVFNRWIQVVAWSPSDHSMREFKDGRFVPYAPSTSGLSIVRTSVDHYRGHREHLGCARVEAALGEDS